MYVSFYMVALLRFDYKQHLQSKLRNFKAEKVKKVSQIINNF